MSDRSLRIDAAGNPHLAYGGDSLYYSYNAGADGWRYEIADQGPGVGQYAALAISASAAYISYYDELAQDLKLATRAADGAWHLETVAQTGDVGKFTGIALDPAGTLHIVYQDWTFSRLMHARRPAGGGWEFLQIDVLDGASAFPSLMLNPASGRPAVSYFAGAFGSRRVRYASFNGSAWQPVTVEADANSVAFTSLALDSTGKPFIAYQNTQDGTLHLREGATWIDTVVDGVSVNGTHTDAGASPSIMIGPDDEPQIAYQRNLRLAYAYRTAAGWHYETIDGAAAAGTFNALALDASGAAHVSYAFKSEYIGELKYARREGSAVWVDEVIDRRGVEGQFADLAFSKQGKAQIAYHSLYDGKALRYAVEQSNGWGFLTPDRRMTGTAGLNVSLFLDGQDRPHMSYSGGAYGGLLYARLGASGWLTQTVLGDTAQNYFAADTSMTLDAQGKALLAYAIGAQGQVGMIAEAALWQPILAESALAGSEVAAAAGADGALHLVYTAGFVNAQQLWYAQRQGGSWVKTAIAPGAATALALVLDEAGRPHVSYYDSVGGHLVYATLSGGAWSHETVASGASVALYSDIVIGPDGAPRIAFYDGGMRALRYAVRSVGGWTLEEVDASGDAGQYAALAASCDGTVGIAYYDAAARDLKLATRDEGAGTCGGASPDVCTTAFCLYLPLLNRDL